MWETASLVSTRAFQGVVGTLKFMTLKTTRTFLAIPDIGECRANGCIRIDVYMGVAALGLRTVATYEMDASGDTMSGGLMRKIAGKAKMTSTFGEKLLADSNFCGIMQILARGAFTTLTYE